MPLRLSHLMTLTISLTWVARFTLPSTRCERSPNPVIVGVNTLCPRFCRRSATRRQHQPPCQAPCTSTKVLGAPVCAAAGVPPKAAALAPAPALASTPRRVIARRWLWSSCPPYALFVVLWLNLTWDASVHPEQRERKTLGAGFACPPYLPTRPPVDNRDNRRPSRQRPARAYTGRSSESPGQLHALSAPVSRRAARAASGFGGRGPARAAQE